ncbi:PAS domain S-box-containing protein [Desulfatibacillum alkenivorans DSM 16219]|uniref:PAS domain S-box-containing protein n=1 Tax=Desulfatibacillum alkenivorans DSM 16219 TaxID=1121393 RepID=A0A1M6YKC5_9BACT|nr:sigma 54-interacting transcriptional regulator [Desulfatibacillum alkenivorans]SHL18708.1 PAS domain S-box-containing protein [Desulfatibacillum alkenivorans DSM 16219]
MDDKDLRIEALEKDLEMHRAIFDSIFNGALVTDEKGIITHFNKPYGDFLGVDPESQIGRHCTESVVNSRMHIVARTGEPEINQSHNIIGKKMVVQRIPIKRDGRVIAVFGQVLFKDVKDLSRLASELKVLESKVKLYEAELLNLRSTRYTLDSIIGVSRTIRELKQEALRAAATHYPVLICGESGTGKELFAQAIHHASNRKLFPFVRINCAAIPKDLLEAELFGYEKGAFTGARSDGKPGKFELAHQGTLFLDEVGDLPLEMQPKLLRALEDREFERVGGNKIIRSDLRIIAATNQDLDQMMADGRFRKDLFYRLNVIPINIPPLRKRKNDIIPSAEYILRQLAAEANLPGISMDKSAQAALRNHQWPGNVRELSNVLERTLSALNGKTIGLSDLPFYLHQNRKPLSNGGSSSLKAVQAHIERESICSALEQTGYNKVKAAELLGIHRTLLYKKIKKYAIPLEKKPGENRAPKT